MRTSSVSASVLVSFLSAVSQAGPRESLELPFQVTSRDGAHDVVEAATVGLTAALLAHQHEPRVLRAERVSVDGEPLWRVDVAGRSARDGDGCSAIAAWIAEDGRVVRLSQVTDASAIDDCRAWYFGGDERALDAARDVVDPRDGWTKDPVPAYSDESWGDVPTDEWEQWRIDAERVERELYEQQ
jgi:hypothetical protein